MNKKTALKEGEVLLLLQRKSGKTVSEVAQMLEIHPNHLSKIFKSEKLSQKIRGKAANFFGVQESVFSGNTITEFPTLVTEPNVSYEKSEFNFVEKIVYSVLKCKNPPRHLKQKAQPIHVE